MKQQLSQHFLSQAMKAAFKRHPAFFALLLGAVALGAAANIWPPLLLKQIVDGPLLGGEGDLWELAGFYLAAVLLIGALDFCQEISAAVIGQRILLDTRQQMLHHLQALPMTYYTRMPVGAMLSYFQADLAALQTLFSAGLVSAAADALKVVSLLLTLFALSLPMGIIALAALPVIFLLSNFFRRNIYLTQREVRKRVAAINAAIQEIYSGFKIIKVFGKENFFSQRFSGKLETHRRSMNESSIYNAWFPCLMQMVRAITIALALVVGASQTGTSAALGLSIGALAAAADIFMRIFDPIEAIASEIQTIQQAAAAIDRIDGLFAERPDGRRSGPAPADAAAAPGGNSDIVLTQVDFSYTGNKKIIRQANLTIKAGSKTAIAGRTGSGKTTLLYLIAGLYPPSRGTVTIGGAAPFSLPAEERRRRIGIVPQSIQIFHGSIFDNITLKDDAISLGDAWRALETVGLAETVRALAQGIDTVIGEGEGQLSFGQMQLLSLARAIVTNPPILLLDEWTAGLDARTEQNLSQALRRISPNRTIISISHRISGLLDADTVHIMDAGKIVETGAPDALARQKGWFAIYRQLEDHGWKVCDT